VNPITVWQAAVRDKLLALEAAQPPPQVRVTRPNVTDRLVEVWDGAAWVITDYDSGERSLLQQTSIPWPDGTQVVRLRRSGRTVSLHIQGAFSQALELALQNVLTPGFAPPANMFFEVNRSTGDEPSRLVIYGRYHLEWYKEATGGSGSSGIGVWLTDEGIPTSLPGAPIGLARPDGKEPEHETW
jgi:hypothetical protein